MKAFTTATASAIDKDNNNNNNNGDGDNEDEDNNSNNDNDNSNIANCQYTKSKLAGAILRLLPWINAVFVPRSFFCDIRGSEYAKKLFLTEDYECLSFLLQSK
ncbi:hypothetical protein H4219_004524 [Mycoemilia scoparia]|uniref:Uncharacterized protein n=1 Tax=Mycoemilia scoparia TaxID=417184 RepID=A0A9W7ZX68_9FUNG|nr:hypothetical protein H4219_004524 [Mycoemilia scoparia]